MQTKIFMGTRITPELKACLDALVEEGLRHIPFEGKEYVGAYLPMQMPTIEEMQVHHKHVTDVLQAHLPQLRADTLALLVFPQVFLG